MNYPYVRILFIEVMRIHGWDGSSVGRKGEVEKCSVLSRRTPVLRIATGWLRLDERAQRLGPAILKVAVALESAV